MDVASNKEHYSNIDGLRVISCLCIIAMHIRANSNYQISGWFYNKFIASWTQFVPLFLIISGFGMFCGYYERFKSMSMNLNDYYSKRYKKILPFFAFLILIDIIVEHSISHLIEGLMEITLVFGLLPNNDLSVIGVGWTLGVIFLFYMLFPFVVFLCWSKKRALFSLVISIFVSLLCSVYFFTDKFVIDSFSFRHNLLYCAPFFVSGGYSYLYRKEIKEFVSLHRWMCLLGCVGITVIYYLIPIKGNLLVIKNLVLFLPWLWYFISVDSKILSNRVMKYLSGISLELYLAQMLMFRVIEKCHCLYLFGTGWVSFIVVWIVVIIGLIAFIEVYKRVIAKNIKKLFA